MSIQKHQVRHFSPRDLLSLALYSGMPLKFFNLSTVVRIVCHVRGPKIPKIPPQMFRTKIVHTCGTFFDFFDKMSKNSFKPCHNIEFNTTNPNTILKITICFSKTPKCPNTFEILESKSTVYPQKQTRTDVSGHANCAEFQCASFIKNIIYIY
jgi:hypothetical protein